MKQMNLELIIQRGISQREKQMSRINAYIRSLERCADEPVCRAAGTQGTDVWARAEERRESVR